MKLKAKILLEEDCGNIFILHVIELYNIQIRK